VNASVAIMPIVCAMLSTSENTISETIDVSISVDTKKDASMVVVWGDYLFTIAVAVGRGKEE
jgi:hypothetical protein